MPLTTLFRRYPHDLISTAHDRDQFLREDEGEDGSLNAAFKGLSRKQKADLIQVTSRIALPTASHIICLSSLFVSCSCGAIFREARWFAVCGIGCSIPMNDQPRTTYQKWMLGC